MRDKPPEEAKRERIERLEVRRNTADKLRVLLDADVQEFFDASERELVSRIVEASKVQGDECRILALRLNAFRDIRAFVQGAATSHGRLTEQLKVLTNGT